MLVRGETRDIARWRSETEVSSFAAWQRVRALGWRQIAGIVHLASRNYRLRANGMFIVPDKKRREMRYLYRTGSRFFFTQRELNSIRHQSFELYFRGTREYNGIFFFIEFQFGIYYRDIKYWESKTFLKG